MIFLWEGDRIVTDFVTAKPTARSQSGCVYIEPRRKKAGQNNSLLTGLSSHMIVVRKILKFLESSLRQCRCSLSVKVRIRKHHNTDFLCLMSAVSTNVISQVLKFGLGLFKNYSRDSPGTQ